MTRKESVVFCPCDASSGSNLKTSLDSGVSFEAPGGAMVASVKVIEPATEKVLAEVPEAGVDDADHAAARAKAALRAWGAVTPGDRGQLLGRFAPADAGGTEALAQREARP